MANPKKATMNETDAAIADGNDVRKRDAVAVFCEHDGDIPCSTVGCGGRSWMDVVLTEEG